MTRTAYQRSRVYGSTEVGLGARVVQSPLIVALVLGTSYMAVALTAFLITADPRLLLVGATMAPFVILLVPQVFQRSFDLLAPLNFIALSVLFGTTLRSLYVVAVEDRITREFLLLREPPEFLLPAALLINAAVACLVVGYLVKWPSLPLHKAPILRREGWSDRKVGRVAAVLMTIGGTCVVLYVLRLDIDLGQLGSLSAKRRLEVANAEYGHAAMGYYLWGMSLLSYAFYLLWSHFAFSDRRLFSVAGVSTLAVGLVAAVPPFLTSSRTGVLALLVYGAIIWNYGRRPITGRWMGGAVVSGLLVLTLMAGLRSMGRTAGPGGLQFDAMALPEAVLGNRNWLGITKTAHLMDAVPSEIEFQKGKSFLTWMAAPIPRTLWPEKPVIRVGIAIGEEVFDKSERTSGVPPGFIGELYLNFGYFGVLGGMLGLGIVLRVLYASFWPLLRTSPSSLLVYTVIVFPVSFTLVTTDVSGAVIEILRSLITLAVLLPLVCRPEPSRMAEAKLGRPRADQLTTAVDP